MYQIDNATAAVSRPAATSAGSAGWFTDGNPGAGDPATIVPAEWLNMVQAELIAVLTAGSVTPSKSDSGQLAAAIAALISASSQPAGSVSHIFGTTAPAGWLVRNGLTIGSASSGASGRANADTAALFAAIWNNTDNTMNSGAFQLLDSSGTPAARGASAAADFAANRRIPLPDDRDVFDQGTASGGTVGLYTADSVKIDGTFQTLAEDGTESGVFTYGPGTPEISPGGATTFKHRIVTMAGGGTVTKPKSRNYLPIIKL